MSIRLRRNNKGNQLAEFGPAVIILVLAIIVPVVVMLYIGIGYACGWYLNFLSVRACAAVPEARLQYTLDVQQAFWTNSHFPAFACARVVRNSGPDGTVASIRESIDDDRDTALVDPSNPQSGVRQAEDLDDIVRVETVIEITPIVQLPFLPLSPWRFTYYSERPIEEYDQERGS